MALLLAKDLRNAVLHAAITGRLTKNEIGDSDVLGTLYQCKVDKEKSINEGKFRKEQFRSPVDNSDLPEIPKYWIWAYISDVTLFQEGPGILAVDFCKIGVPLIRIAGLQSNEVKLHGCNYLDPEKVELKWKHYKLDKGDIVLSTSASMDKVCEVGDDAVGAIPYTGQIRFKMYGGINKEYFKLFVKSPYYMKQISEQEKGGMIKHYGPTHLRKMFISIPPIEEQERIVAKVDELMGKIDEYEKLEKQLEELQKEFPGIMRDAILQAALQGRLTEQSYTDTPVDYSLLKTKNYTKLETLYDLPESWINSHLKDITVSIPTKKYQVLDSEVMDQGKYPVISQSKDFSIGFTNDEKKLCNINKPVVLFGDHTCVTKIIDYSFVVGADGVKLFEVKNCINPKYLYFVLNYNSSRIQNLGGYSRHYKFLKNVSIPLPPIEEQQRIVDKLDQLLPLCDAISELV